MSLVLRMDSMDWTIALVAVVIVGFFCTKGFGSRTNY